MNNKSINGSIWELNQSHSIQMLLYITLMSLFLASCSQRKVVTQWDVVSINDPCDGLFSEVILHSKFNACYAELHSRMAIQSTAINDLLKKYRHVDFRNRKSNLKMLSQRMFPWKQFISQVEFDEFTDAFFIARVDCSEKNPRLCMLHFTMLQSMKMLIESLQEGAFYINGIVHKKNTINLCRRSTTTPARLPFSEFDEQPYLNKVTKQLIQLHLNMIKVEKQQLGCDVFINQPDPIFMTTSSSQEVNLPDSPQKYTVIWCHDRDVSYTTSYPVDAILIEVEKCDRGVRKLWVKANKTTAAPLQLWIGNQYRALWVK